VFILGAATAITLAGVATTTGLLAGTAIVFTVVPALVWAAAGLTETTAGFGVGLLVTFTVVGEGFALLPAITGATFTVWLGAFAAGFSTTVGTCANAAAAIVTNKARFRFIASCLWPQLQSRPAEYHG
jgi:hypothetical protein